MLIPRRSPPLQIRSARITQYLLKPAKPPHFEQKPSTNSFFYATLFNDDEYLMAKLSLWSLLKNISRFPTIHIGCDPSTDPTAAAKLLENLPTPTVYHTVEEVATYWRENNCENLAWFCEQHIFGFKLAFNLFLSQTNTVLYSDTDVLWFDDPTDTVQNATEGPLYASIDSGDVNYEPELMNAIATEFPFEIGRKPQGCAGVSVFNPSAKDTPELQFALDFLRKSSSIKRLSEQSIVSSIAKRYNCFLPKEFAIMDAPMRPVSISSGGQKLWIARHYAGPFRTQFWIDAFFARLPKPAFP